MPRLLVILPPTHAAITIEGYDVLPMKTLEAVQSLATHPAAIVTHDELLATYAFLVASSRRLDSALPHDPLPPPIIPALGPAAPLLRLMGILAPEMALLATRAITVTPAFSSPTTAAQAIVVMLAATLRLPEALQTKMNAHAPLSEEEKQIVDELYDTSLVLAHGSSTLTHAVTVSKIQTKIAIRLARAVGHVSPTDALSIVRAHYPNESPDLWLRIASVLHIDGIPEANIIEVPLDALHVGDCLATDLVNTAGHLVARRGYLITETFLRHREAQDYGSLPDRIAVQRT